MTLPLPPDANDRPGALGERYELGELLGRGGMGKVYRAWDRDLDRAVAVKVLAHDDADEWSGDDGQRSTAGSEGRRLLAEARAAAGLNHPHVVAVHDVGTSADGVFVVMELVAGRTWRDELRWSGPQPEHEAARIAAAVASALAAAHERGVIHRDVNPGNVMITADGTPKLMDFGIARVEHVAGLTRSGQVVGTPAYMAPEQIRDERLDDRCDVYSLGCTLYEAITGRLPFTGAGAAEMATARLHGPPRPPRQLVPGVSVGMEGLVLRALALRPGERPDAASLARSLADLAARRPPGRDDDAAGPTAATDALARSGRSVDHDGPGPTTGARDTVEVADRTTDGTTRSDGSTDDADHTAGAGLRRAGAVLVGLGALALVLVVVWLLVR